MKALLILNAVILFLAAAFAVNLAVVCLLYGVNLDIAPQLGAQMPLLLKVTGIFTAVMISAGFAFFGQRRKARWFWPAQGVLLVVLTVGGFTLAQLLG